MGTNVDGRWLLKSGLWFPRNPNWPSQNLDSLQGCLGSSNGFLIGRNQQTQ